MQPSVRFIVYSGDEAFSAEMRAMLLRIDGVKVVAEVDELALLTQAAEQFSGSIVLANLDPAPESVLPIIGDMVTANRAIAVFAVSESGESQLILKAMRSGVREFLPKPVDAKTLTEAIERAASDRTESVVQGKLIAVVGASGGVGASLIATNLAVELGALADRDVTIADLDYRYGQVATLLDVDPRYSIADLCGTPEALEPQVIGRALIRHESGIQILSRPNQLSDADTITAAACTGVFVGLSQLNDYVVADGPMRYDVSSKAVLAMADITFLVVQQHVPCVRNAVRIIENLRENGFNLDRTKLLCNRVERSSGHLSVKDVVATLGLELFATIPEDWEAANGATNLGEPLSTYSPKSKLRLAIKEIAERLHQAEGDADEKVEAKQGLIGRIFASS